MSDRCPFEKLPRRLRRKTPITEQERREIDKMLADIRSIVYQEERAA